ncbi:MULTISPECIES: hypothetical protein [unclassified Janthinobacterium]|uniref:hypothetical protein n=1 Tax=unclassified Janthinobacterium TaxID=2610881 RepID=UPI00160B16C2|nr:MULTISPECIES: hypothetical protein [unclassified Janthinobacterium]MBB5371284.1 hypothetical protein [Janthinobacterium sp. K2C7]MBB5384090.1 hypothetical protein [Janthinobacterium sp. K2Li3]MBB5389450.1 hypothetical protein [Janthinobacterium sp. K2E3]
MNNIQPEDFRNLPSSERQLIIVQPDEVAAASRRSAQSSSSDEGSFDWKAAAARVAKTFFLPYGPVISITIEAINAVAKARESGLNVLQIGTTEAQSIQFPPGHPRQQTLYVAHPAKPSVYYTTATFHRMAFEHKFSEAISLLMSLGAKTITVEHVRGWSREFSAKVSTPLAGVEAEAGLGQSAKSGHSLLFEAKLKNNSPPSIPEDLVWFPHEPTWQAVAQGRVKFGLSKFSLAVNYDDDFTVNAGLKVRVQKAGLDLGGTFEDHMATTWKIFGDFEVDN